MTAVTHNFNRFAVAGNQRLIPSVLPSVSWFHTYFIIWMWLATSDDADQAQEELENHRQQALAHERSVAEAKKRRIARGIEEQPRAPDALPPAPAFR